MSITVETRGAGPRGPSSVSAVRGVTPRARRIDRWSRHAVFAAAGVNVVIIALVVVFLAGNAAPIIHDAGLGGIFGTTTWDPDAGIGFGGVGSFGIVAPILGSLLVVGLALLLAVPAALAVAIFLSETNPVSGERFLRPALEVFVGIPSVVYGYLGFIVLLPILERIAPPGHDGSGILAAGLVLAVMIIPTIATLSADGLRSLGPGLREGSTALGATQWQTIRRVLLPAARAPIVSGVVLGLARAMGEALAVALVIGDVNVIPQVGHYGIRALFLPFTTMTVTITDGVDKLAVNPQGTAARYLLALVLLLITFLCITLVRMVQRRGQVL